MTHAVTIVSRRVQGADRVVYAKVDITAYVANGVAITPASMGLVRMDMLEILGASDLGYVGQFIPASNKIKVWQGNNDGASDGPLVEAGTVDVGEFLVKGIGR